MTNEKENNTKPYQNLSVERKEGSVVSITGEVPYETLSPYRDAVVSEAKQEVEVDGFRKGNAPEHLVIEKLGGEEAVLWKAAERALSEIYPRILQDEQIDAIGRPQVTVTKLAENNPLEFQAETAVMPDITLPDYTSIAAQALSEADEEGDTSVSDEEVEQVVQQVLQSKAEQDKQQSGEGEQEGSSGASTLYDADGNPIQSQESEEQKQPELTDELVQSLGNFNTVAEFKDTIRKNLSQEKQQREQEKRRLKAAEAIIEKAELDVPDLLVQSELEKMMSQFQQDVERMGTTLDDYLQRAGKTKEGLREEWKPEAEKRAKLQLILNKIAVAENLVPSDEEIQQQVQHIMQRYPSADEQAARSYASTILTNEKVFQLLESHAPTADKGEKEQAQEGEKGENNETQ